MAQTKIMIIGSDGFSDLYGGKLAQAFQDLAPNISLFGVGGINMRDSGVRLLYNISELENIGGLEALKTSMVIKRLVQRISESLDKLQPKVVIQIGLPVFNLRLIEIAQSKGIPIIYYNTPLNWSSTQVKAAHLGKLVTKVLGVSQFETKLCQEYNIGVEFVGHPLVDIVNSAQYKVQEDQVRVEPKTPALALFPGLNEFEVKGTLPVLLKAAQQLRTDFAGLRVIVALPPSIKEACSSSLRAADGWEGIQVSTDTHGIFHEVDAAVVTCGSISIEAALAKVPAVAVHKVAAATYFLDKMLSRKAYIAMVNYLLQTPIVPELIQNDFTKNKVVEEASKLLFNQKARQEYAMAVEDLPQEFGEPGTITRAALAVLDHLQTDA